MLVSWLYSLYRILRFSICTPIVHALVQQASVFGCFIDHASINAVSKKQEPVGS